MVVLQVEMPSIKTVGTAGKNPVRWILDKQLSRGFWVFITAAFFFDFGFAVYFFLFNLYLLDLHFNERMMGLVGGALMLGSVAGTLPVGMLAKKFGLRPLLLVCFTAAPTMGILRAATHWPSAQIGLAFLGGIAMCIWGVCFLPAIARLTTEENRAFAFSLIFSVSIGTSALGGVVCGYLPQWLLAAGIAMEAADVKRLILFSSCAIAVIGIIPVLLLRFPEEQSKDQTVVMGQARGWRTALRVHPFLLRFLPSMALWTAVLACFTPFANVFLSRDRGVPLVQVGAIFAIAQVVQFSVGLITPIVFRRMGLINGIVATQIATAIAMGGLAVTQNTHLAVVLYLALTATQWMSSPGLYNLLMSKIPDEQRSTASALTMFSNALLQSGATATAGILFAHFGYPRVLAGVAVLALMAAMLFKFSLRHRLIN